MLNRLQLIILVISNLALNSKGFSRLVTTYPEWIVSRGLQSNSLLKNGYLDVTLYDGWNGNRVDSQGVVDSTLAIQKAVDDARSHSLVLFFPHQKNRQRGVYLISKMIDCRMRSYSMGFRRANILIGSRSNGQRPLIRLKSGAVEFQDTDNPRPMFWFWSQGGHWRPEEFRHTNDPTQGQPDISFDQTFRGIDLDLGGNPGAIGLKNPGAQGSTMQHVTINAKGSFAGIANTALLGGSYYDVEIIGGNYGIIIDTRKEHAKYNLQGAMYGFTFRDQQEAVLRIFGNQPVPMLFVGFYVENKLAIPFNIGNFYWGTGGLVLVDGAISVSGGELFDRNSNGIYIRNVYVRGADSFDGVNIINKTNWTHIKEHSVPSQNFANLLDGQINKSTVTNAIEGLTFSVTQLVNSLQKKHMWSEAEFPTFERNNLINVKDVGAKGDGAADDTNAIQSAINTASSENKIVFLPRGDYKISKTIVLKANTKLIGAAKTNTMISPLNSFRPPIYTPIISTENSQNSSAILSDMTIGQHMSDYNSNGVIDEYLNPRYNVTQVDQFQFTALEWRLGRDSIVKDVSTTSSGYWWESSRCEGHRFHIKGFGGGRWFNVFGSWQGAISTSRGFLIENTHEPMHIYSINFATDPPNVTIEIIGSSNKYFYYPTFEGGYTSFRTKNSNNIAIFGNHKNNFVSENSNRGVFEFIDSTNIVLSMGHMRMPDTTINVNTVYEKNGSSVVRLINDRPAIYRNGIVGLTPIINALSKPYGFRVE